MPLHTVEPQRLYRRIAGQLRRLIDSGEYSPGQRIPAERDLAVQLGVSRPSVREALIALEVEGVIEVRTGSGIYVCNAAADSDSHSDGGKRAAGGDHAGAPDWGPLQVLAARLLVESEVAALAARHARAADLKALRTALAQMKALARRGQVPRQGDRAFHLALARACGNEVLRDTVQRCWQAQEGKLFTRLSGYFESPQSWQAAIAEHGALLAAVAAHDAPAARRAMQRHLRQTRLRYSASWRSVAPAPDG